MVRLITRKRSSNHVNEVCIYASAFDQGSSVVQDMLRGLYSGTAVVLRITLSTPKRR